MIRSMAKWNARRKNRWTNTAEPAKHKKEMKRHTHTQRIEELKKKKTGKNSNKTEKELKTGKMLFDGNKSCLKMLQNSVQPEILF